MYIHHIVTTVPEQSYSQDSIRDLMVNQLGGSKKISRYIRRIYKHSGIEKRHSILKNFTDGKDNPYFAGQDPIHSKSLSTGERNQIYTQESLKMFLHLAKEALEKTPGINPKNISHVITVSCTGFFNPGPDYHIVKELGLKDSTQRYHLGFMGCYAAFPALRMAKAFCEADPNAVILIVCVELCTLHFQYSQELDHILSSSLFADGGAAAIVSAESFSRAQSAFKLLDFQSDLIRDGEKEMSWIIGDLGFEIQLTNYVTTILNSNVPQIMNKLLHSLNMGIHSIELWALHPGGRAIIDKLEKSLGLKPIQLQASRNVLRQFGNMSSPTILFVLKEIMMNTNVENKKRIAALAFGPGITVETGILEFIPAEPHQKIQKFNNHHEKQYFPVDAICSNN